MGLHTDSPIGFPRRGRPARTLRLRRLAPGLLIAFWTGGASFAQEREPIPVDWKHDWRRERREGGNGTPDALRAALTWLVNHQSADGSWDSDGFSEECGRLGDGRCDGPGNASHDVGVTGLALLALAGADANAESGGFKDSIGRAVEWLLSQQDEETGRIGENRGHDSIYDHLIATYALVDSLYTLGEPGREPVQRAVDFALSARNPGAAWRYDYPPTGSNDTSVTAWAMSMLIVARNREGLKVPDDAIEGGMKWITAATDEKTARVGYDSVGSVSSRTPANDHYERSLAETLTAAGLWCRYLAGEPFADDSLMERQAELILRRPPEWVDDRPANDMYGWYYGTYAMFQRGGKDWKTWNRAMKKALVGSQVKRGEAQGSWDPVGPWGHVGGRVYSTALMALTLEVYYRYPRFDR